MPQSYIIYYVVKLSPSLKENFTVRAWGTLVWWFKTPHALVANNTFLWQAVCPRGQLSASRTFPQENYCKAKSMPPSLIFPAENAGAGSPFFKRALGNRNFRSGLQGCRLNLIFALNWRGLLVLRIIGGSEYQFSEHNLWGLNEMVVCQNAWSTIIILPNYFADSIVKWNHHRERMYKNNERVQSVHWQRFRKI